VRWHTEFPLIKCYKGHHVSFRWRGECRVLWHVAGRELRCHHKPLVHEALQVTLRDLGRGPILFRHG
jgi:hypothetical protein